MQVGEQLNRWTHSQTILIDLTHIRKQLCKFDLR